MSRTKRNKLKIRQSLKITKQIKDTYQVFKAQLLNQNENSKNAVSVATKHNLKSRMPVEVTNMSILRVDTRTQTVKPSIAGLKLNPLCAVANGAPSSSLSCSVCSSRS